MSFTFVHAADIHLDSPLGGLEKYDGAPVDYVRGASRRAFENLVEFCLQQEARFLIIAGDLYDGDWRDYNTGLFFAAQMAKLREAGIKVFLVKGNHDAASQISRQLRLPDNVYEFPSDAPDSILMEDLGVAIHGCSFSKVAVSEDLSLHYPEPQVNYLNIGVLHTSAGGREGHENYAPCKQAYLENKGYDYWALGHIHQREVLHSKNPWIVFPGNLQGRHIRETGPKGASLVMVNEGRIEQVQHHSLDVLRWKICRIQAEGVSSFEQIYQLAQLEMENALEESEGRLLGIRILIEGACPIHGDLLNHKSELNNNLRALATDIGQGELWLEKLKIHTTHGFDRQQLIDDHSAFSFLFKYLCDLRSNEAEWQEILSEVKDLKSNLPPVLTAGSAVLNLDQNEVAQGLLDEVEEMLMDRLSRKEGTR